MEVKTPFSSEKSPDFDTAFSQARNIHIFFLAAIPLYAILGIVLKLFVMGSDPGFVGLPDSMYSTMLSILSLVSVVLGVIVLFVLPRQNAPQKLIKKEPISSSEELGQALLKAHMARMSLAQAIAIFGLVLFFLNGDLLPLFAFSSFTLILLLFTFPRRTEWDEARTLLENDMA